MKLNLRQIEVFRAIMLSGSISGASKLLFVSQPAVSRLIAYTEQRLGLMLFERIKGRLYPTPEARRLFVEVTALYQNVQRVNEVADNPPRTAKASCACPVARAWASRCCRAPSPAFANCIRKSASCCRR